MTGATRQGRDDGLETSAGACVEAHVTWLLLLVVVVCGGALLGWCFLFLLLDVYVELC